MTPGRERMRRALPAAGLLLAAVFALSACGAQARPAPSATALPQGIVATLLPATPAQAADTVRLWVENDTSEDLSLTRIRIEDPRFVGIGRKVEAGTIQVGAGKSAEIEVVLPAVDCTAGATPTPTAAVTETETAAPTPARTAPPEQTSATIGFALGAAIGVAALQLADPDDVIAAHVAAHCG